MKQLYANKWYWYLGALLCAGLGVYWIVTFTSSHNNIDLLIGVVTLGIAGSAVWRACTLRWSKNHRIAHPLLDCVYEQH